MKSCEKLNFPHIIIITGKSKRTCSRFSCGCLIIDNYSTFPVVVKSLSISRVWWNCRWSKDLRSNGVRTRKTKKVDSLPLTIMSSSVLIDGEVLNHLEKFFDLFAVKIERGRESDRTRRKFSSSFSISFSRTQQTFLSVQRFVFSGTFPTASDQIELTMTVGWQVGGWVKRKLVSFLFNL